MPVPHHSSFLQAGCSSCHPTNSIKALKAGNEEHNNLLQICCCKEFIIVKLMITLNYCQGMLELFCRSNKPDPVQGVAVWYNRPEHVV